MPFLTGPQAHDGAALAGTAHLAWRLITRLGEAQILLPAMAVALLWLVVSAHARTTAWWWLVGTGLAVVITTATKVAFFGYEIGYAPLDYTGVSGHAVFAAAVLPVLAGIAAGGAAPGWRRTALCAGYALAALIAYSRLRVGAHSASECVAGWLLGSLASAAALRVGGLPERRPPAWLGAVLLLWMLGLPLGAPPSTTHGWVIRLSLALSERPAPYQRWMMHRDHLREPQRRQTAQGSAQARLH
jgi:membrane-associated phospholipid phosphatase